MNENVLREFLVSLGFKVDEAGLKKFSASVERVSKTVLKMGAGVAATAAGVVAGVKIISSQMENLYYASQRTGASVSNIMALRYAAHQIGLTADQAQGALENFARTLRLNPGSSGLLDSLGVTGKDPAEKLDSFIGKMKEMEPYVAAAYAQLFGIDPDTLLMLEQGQDKRLELEKAYRKKLAAFGIDPEQAAEAGKDFNNSLRSATDTLRDLWIVIESKLAPVLTTLVDQFERWAETNAGEVANEIADAVKKLAAWLQSIDWKEVGDDIVSVYHALGGLKGILVGLAAIQLAPLVGGILSLAGAVVRLGAAASGAGIAALLKPFAALGLLFHSEDLNQGEDEYLAPRRKLGKTQTPPNESANNGNVQPSTVPASADDSASGAKAPSHSPPRGIRNNNPGNNGNVQPSTVPASADDSASGAKAPSHSPPRGIRNNNPGNIEYGSFTKSMGATGSDGRFAVFPTMEAGIQAAIKLLQNYAARGFDTIRTIISKWAPASENKTAEYIDAVAKKLGISADAHLSGDQLSGVAQAIFAHENGSAYKNVSALMASVDNTRLGASETAGNRNVSMHQTNTFHIAGSSDPNGTARAVAAEQTRIYGDLVRNFSGAVQ